MKQGNWFDAAYFGHKPVSAHKSNYSRIDGGYKEEMAAPVEFVDWVVAELKKKRLKPERILEIGCASGAAVREFRNRDIDAMGIDASGYILGKAQEDVRDYLFQMDMMVLVDEAPEERAYTAVVSKDVMEHITEDKIDAVLLALSKICKVQLHVINTGEFEYQAAHGDQSHFLLQPLAWWEAKATELGIRAVFKAT